MTGHDELASQFESKRAHLRGVAYRMLGSLSEADDAVQEAWMRLQRADADTIENQGGWLTSVVARVCLDMLRTRKSRREESIEGHVPDPIVSREDASHPEHDALLADSVGLALLIVLETLEPAERLAFVLHDLFALPFGEIAPIVGRTPAAARQLASRARRRVQSERATPDPDRPRQRAVLDAFLAASRGGDLQALLAVLDPDVVLRADQGVNATRVVRGARTVAEQSRLYSRSANPNRVERRALVNGSPGLVTYLDGVPVSVLTVTVADDRIVAIDILADPARVRALPLPPFDG